jgi:hypothetical protein
MGIVSIAGQIIEQAVVPPIPGPLARHSAIGDAINLNSGVAQSVGAGDWANEDKATDYCETKK